MYIDFDNNNKYKHIIHLADIHIRNKRTRHKEYDEVFDNLYENIKNKQYINKNTTCIIIAGDLFHDARKDGKLSPNAIRQFKDFVLNLNKYGHLVIIPGNHDNNITFQYNSDNTKIDALSSILNDYAWSKDNLNSNIFYIKSTGKYKLGNLILYHTSVFDIDKINKPNQYKDRLKYLIPKSDLFPNCKHIGIIHCGVQNQVLQNGHILKDYAYKISDIEQYDICCLGDTHEHQFFGEKQNVAYSNSLIQQSHGESISNHGYILWDLDTYKGILHEITNNYGYITITPNDNIETINFPKYSTIKLRYNSECDIDINQMKSIINKYTKIISWKEEQIWSQTAIDDTCIDEELISDSNIMNYINEKFPGQDNIDKRNIMFHKLSNVIKNKNQDIGRLSCKLLSLNFENFQAYKDGGHIIDFSKYNLNSTISITGNNTVGKSTIIRALRFAIWGADNGKVISLIHNECKVTKVILIFEHDHDKYKIIRKITKPNKRSLILKLYNTDTQKWSNISIKNKKKIQTDYIDKYFGTKENAKITWFSEQDSSNQFINSQKNYDTFQTFIGADIFNIIHEDAIKEKKNIEKNIRFQNKLIKEININDDDQLLENILNDNNNQLNQLNDTLSNTQNLLDIEMAKLQYGTLNDFNNWNQQLKQFQNINDSLKNDINPDITKDKYLLDIQAIQNLLKIKRKNKETLNIQLPNKPPPNNITDTIETLNNKLEHIKHEISIMPLESNNIQSDLIETKTKLKLQKKLYKQFNDININITDKTKSLESIHIDSDKYTLFKSKLSTLQTDIAVNISKLNDFNVDDINLFNKLHTKYTNKINKINTNILNIQNKINKQKSLIIPDIPDKITIDNNYLLLQNIKNQINTTQNDINIALNNLSHLQKYSKLIFNDQCKCCSHNITHLPIDSIKISQKKLNKLNKSKSKLDDEYDKYKIYDTYHDNFIHNQNISLKITNLKSKLLLKLKDLDKYTKEFDSNNNHINNYHNNLALFNTNSKLEKKLKNIQTFINDTDIIINKRDTLTSEINKLKSNLEQIQYSPDTMSSLQNKFKLLTDISIKHKQKDTILQNILNINLLNEYNTIINQIQIIQNDINLLENKYNHLTSEYNKQSDIEQNILKNNISINQLQNKILLYQNKGGYDSNYILTLKNKIKSIQENKQNISRSIGEYQNRFQIYLSNIQKTKNIQNDIDIFNKQLDFIKDYCTIVDPRNGYPQKLITSSLDRFTHLINNFVHNAGYTYYTNISPPTYDINSKKKSDKLIITYTKNNQLFSQLSGAEKSVFNIAVQTSLGKLLNTTTPPVQIMDEAFSSLDTTHIDEIPRILNIIKSQFNHIIYISHNEFIKNKADYSIIVQKNNNSSSITCTY